MKTEDDSLKKWEKNYRRELYLVAAVLAAALILGLHFWSGKGKEAGEKEILEITIDGELYGTFSLKEDREFEVTSDYGSNTVVIEQGMARVSEADCPDKICVGMGEIDREGENICCLPHRLFLTVKNSESGDYDAMTY